MAEKKAQPTINPILVITDLKTTSPSGTSFDKLEDDRSDNASRVAYSGDIDGIYVIGFSQEELDFYATFTPKMRAALNRKIDVRLVPMLATLYFISHLDRGNIGNANIEGMARDLNLSGVQYNVALAIFFVSYIIFEIPSNALLKQLTRPRFYLGALTIAFGFISCMTGIVTNFAGLVACRFMLGVFEAGFFPAAIYLCSTWYMPSDLAVRMGGMYCTGALSGAFSGLLAAAITQMDGVGGYEGWRWIFIIEGIATCGIGISTIFLLVDLPSTSTGWLRPAELRVLELQRKMKQGGLDSQGTDVEGGATGFKWRELSMVVTNWKNWVLVSSLVCQAIGFYGAKFHLPSLTKSMGFSNTNAQLLSAPPYLLACVGCIVVPYISDRCKRRGYFLFVGFAMMTVGWAYVLALQGNFSSTSRLAPGYLFTCIAVTGCYFACPLITTWGNNNTAPAGRRAMVSAFLITIGNMGGIVGSFMYLAREAPVYNTGNSISLVVGFIGCVCTVVLVVAWKRANQENAKRSEEEVRLTYSDDELLRLGNKSPLFRYTI